MAPDTNGDVADASISDGAGGIGGVGASGGTGGGAGGTGPDPSHVALDPECDMNGIWIADLVTVSEALLMPQYANTFHYFEIEQDGADFVVTKHFNCGIEVQGTATVTLSVATTKALMTVSRQEGRVGTMQLDGSTCAFDLDRYWALRGAEDSYKPTPQNSSESMAQVQASLPLPDSSAPAGAVEFEGDGIPGMALNVTGIVNGTRHSIQRDWHRGFSSPDYPVAPARDWPDPIVVQAQFEHEESVLSTTPSGDFTLAATSMPRSNDGENRLRFRFLGRSADDPRYAAVVVGTDPEADPEGSHETCMNIRTELPFERARP